MYQAYSGVSRLPEPAVTEKATRRKFSAEYKLRILAEAEASTERGQIGALLRREGLYASTPDKWRKQRSRRLVGHERTARYRRWMGRKVWHTVPQDSGRHQ